jgi:hypothetical protein
MSPPGGTCETRNIKSGSEKRIVAGHVGDITSGAAKTPLEILRVLAEAKGLLGIQRRHRKSGLR